MKRPGIVPLDIIILFAILACAVLCIKKSVSSKNSSILVEAAGETYQYSLSQDGTYTVQGELGPTTFEIKNHRVHILDSACPGKNCVHQGYASPLVCLPNKVIITIEEYGEFDAVSE